ncbi:MAG TPA: hypothetical protein VI643_08315 [Planctomycetota bacterium]|nr:hypothetical protein [Planctomycetota bacterium]
MFVLPPELDLDGAIPVGLLVEIVRALRDHGAAPSGFSIRPDLDEIRPIQKDLPK